MERNELAHRCEQIERAGGSVRDYLSDQGFISPWGTWFRLQKEELGRKDCNITDGKGCDEMRKLTLEDKKKAVEIAIGGGNPVDFLKERGCKNPSASWYYIKQALKAADPEKYELLNGKKEDEPKQMPKVELTISAEDLARAAEQGDGMTCACTKAVNYDGFDVMAVKSPVSGFRFESDPRYGTMTWRTISGDEVSLTADEWRMLADELTKVLKIFGI